MRTAQLRASRVSAFIFAAVALVACGEAGEDRASDPFSSAVVRLGDAVAAEVDGTPIYVSDVRREAVAQGVAESAEPLDSGSRRFDEVLDDLIHRRIFALEARRRELHDTDESRRRLAAAREVILYNMVIETVLDEAVTEDVLRTLYEEQSQLLSLGEEVRARHILTETFEQAQEVARRLRDGEDFAQLALDMSTDDPTRLNGGDLGYFSQGELIIEEIERAAFDTEVGQITQPFRSELGWHVLRVDDRRAEEPPSFEEMRPDLVRFLTYQELQRLSDVLEERAEIRRFAGAISEESEPPAGVDDAAPEDDVIDEDDDGGDEDDD